MAKLDVGDTAPDFTLPGTEGEFTLSAHRGKPVVLLFYPGDDTTVCTKQFCSYRDHQEDMSSLDAAVVGISTKDLASKEAFKAKHGLTTALLADEGGKVAEQYGIKSKLLGGLTKRAVFIIDADGKIAFKHLNPMSLTYDTVDDLKVQLMRLEKSAAA